MAVPKRGELANRRKGSMYNESQRVMSDKSKYLNMKYDYDNGILAEWKKKEFEKLKELFEE